jgi:hypothetical protein
MAAIFAKSYDFEGLFNHGIIEKQMQLCGSCREYSTICLNISNLIVLEGIHLKLQKRYKNDFELL